MLKSLIPDTTKYVLNGQTVSREEFVKHSKGFCFGQEAMTPEPSGWPLYSNALAVHPDLAQEASDYAKELGVPTEYTKGGQPKFESQGHRKRFCEATGNFDRNGCYGDPQRK